MKNLILGLGIGAGIVLAISSESFILACILGTVFTLLFIEEWVDSSI